MHTSKIAMLVIRMLIDVNVQKNNLVENDNTKIKFKNLRKQTKEGFA